MKNISVIGIGRLGLSFALSLEKNGYNVMGVDLHQDYVDDINNLTFISPEPGISKLLKQAKNPIETIKDKLTIINPTIPNNMEIKMEKENPIITNARACLTWNLTKLFFFISSSIKNQIIPTKR